MSPGKEAEYIAEIVRLKSEIKSRDEERVLIDALKKENSLLEKEVSHLKMMLNMWHRTAERFARF